MTLKTSDVLQSRYRVVNLVGQGGFGAVYRAWDTSLRIPVALKENLDSGAAAQRQFEQEAILLAKLAHPSLPRVTDHFHVPGQGQYLVMEFVEGKSLHDLLNERGGPLSEAEVRPWIEQICSALDYLHSRQPPIIHRDIKPQNIILTPDGRVMLVDFGISKVYDAQRGTTAGARAVTPGYSPPEQYGGARTDARSDIYALGATLYTLLTGQEPPESVSLISGAAVMPAPRALNASISAAAEGAILAAMNPSISQRLPTAAALRAALDAPLAAAGRGTAVILPTSQGLPAQPVAPPRPSRPGWLWPAGGLVVALLAVAAALFLWPEPDDPPTTPAATAGVPGGGVAQTAVATHTPAIATATPPAETPVPTLAPTVSVPGGVPLTEQILIPAGPFLMGEDATTVTLDAFLIDRTEVTAAQYAAFLNARGNQEVEGVPWAKMDDPEKFLTGATGNFEPITGYENHPMIQVSWDGAVAYCAYAGRRLPTEAEWEKAARGDDGRRYPWGDDEINCNLANSHDDAGNHCGEVTMAVGSLPAGASPYGVLDMAGNVWEWVEDYYDSTQTNRVKRGGSFIDQAVRATTFYRQVAAPQNRYAHAGFRCAQSVTQTETATPPPAIALGQTQAVELPGGLVVEQVGVPAGSFDMGGDAAEDERPLHEVTLDGFWLDRTEVTNSQFAAFVADTGHLTMAERRGSGEIHTTYDAWAPVEGANWQHPLGPGSDLSDREQHPVVLVTWEDADAFCRWRGSRLPTEAEWEYAARGSAALVFPWGNSFENDLLNYCDSNCPNSWADSRVDDGYEFTAPVGSYPGGVSWVGALDMIGNVYEWVYDWYDRAYYGRSPAANPQGPAATTNRVQRGASWRDYDDVTYAAHRFYDAPVTADLNTGFRCAGD